MPNACRYCFARLHDGSDFCNDDCEDGMWAIVPTIDGEIYEPEEEESPPAFYERDDIYVTRPALEKPPEPHEAANSRDRLYIDGARLRQHLIAANP